MSGSAQTAINLPTGTVSASMGVSGSSVSTGSFGKLLGEGGDITGITAPAITAIASTAANQLLTDDGDATVTSEANLTYDGADLTAISGTASKPVLYLNSTSDDATSPEIKLDNTRGGGGGAANDDCGRMTFYGKDGGAGGGNATQFGEIICEIATATHASEAGMFRFHTQKAGALTETMRISGGGDFYVPGVRNKDVSGDSPVDVQVADDYYIGILSSTERIKKDIEDMGSIDWLYDLRPVEFKWKKNNTSGYGLIAEEAVEVNPYLVTLDSDHDLVEEDGVDRPRTVQYSRLIPFLLRAVQELSAKVEALENA
jgi:hypothetical protein